MSELKYLSCFILAHLIIAIPQLNLYDTDWVSKGGDESKNGLQHDCLRVITYSETSNIFREILYYCLSELPTKFRVENNDFVPKFSFADLFSKNITSQQLYLWSAPIDLIEQYQFYLNELTKSNYSSLATEMFYNCTIPRFGRFCQYEFYEYRSDQSTINQIIIDFYYYLGYYLITLPCYTHLQCNRGPLSVCLDWSEICDGEINCLDGGLDEEHCWQLEINQCQENEYRCMNGQCIPKSFSEDGDVASDCMDRSDNRPIQYDYHTMCYINERPSIGCEDFPCKNTHLTSSCAEQRIEMLSKAMYSNKDNSISKVCWPVFKCLLDRQNSGHDSCDDFCETSTCIKIINNTCPDMIYFPDYPVLFGDIYFALGKNNRPAWANSRNVSLYICYMNVDYNNYFVNISKVSFNKMTCIQAEHFLPSLEFEYYNLDKLYKKTGSKLHNELKRYHLSFNYSSNICNRSMMYQCIGSSKCISTYRLIDGINDCPDMDDENTNVIENLNMTEQMKKTHFKCEGSNKFIPQSVVQDGKCDCDNKAHLCEDENMFLRYVRTNILFQFICDRFDELFPLIVEGQTHTDETDCEQWECNNIYTRCDEIWNCPNGADEAGCETRLTLNCSSKHHLCVSPHTNQLICLSIDKANDGIVDCLGATDEPTLCEIRIPSTGLASFEGDKNPVWDFSFCLNLGYLCDGNRKCQHGDDTMFCNTNQTYYIGGATCWNLPNDTHSRAEWGLYYLDANNVQLERKVFKLDGMIEPIENKKVNNMENKVISSSSNSQMLDQYQLRCHRGLNVRVWLDESYNLTVDTCFCPSSYYGDQCQYQNQRISLAIRFLAFSDSYRTPFAIIISLIDDSDQRIVHSYEHITYLSVSHCKTKFDMYLLYSSRPKDVTKQYAIHIDFFEKISLVYRGSVLLPINFPFLPVHRLAFLVNIPRSDNKTQSCSNGQCAHGKCIKYSNNPDNFTFCRCNEGWSGKYCTIQHTCMCAPGSVCLGISANNRSICVCPLYRFGPRCLLNDTIYQENTNLTCQNNGQYIPDTDEMLKQNFVCLCPKEFSGDRCEIANSKLIFSFDNYIDLSQSIFFHFVQILLSLESDMESTVRLTTFRTIPRRQDSVTIHWTQPFHLVFTELTNKTYYLTVNQKSYKKSRTINKMIKPSDRCPNITELFNNTFIQWHLIRRIKYYHLPCQNQSLNLSCFHDDVHLCLCYDHGEKRLANCFNFDHNMTFDCMGQNECENGAHCLQDHSECPTRSMCICPPCFYGTRCQFSTSGFGLSLDAILGYQIIPDLNFTQQSFIIKMSLALTIIFIVIGFINGILCIITFKNKAVHDVGCGSYLLGSSITTLLIMTIFGLKFLILILAQMAIISNRTFLQVQCHSLDFFLRICISMDQWLNACVAAERAMTVVKATGFDKKKSKKAAKIVIIVLLIVTVGTYIHDPIYRRLIDEENNDDDDGNMKRTWCIINYSSNVEVYNYLINIFHFFGPFIINLISSITLITKQSRQQANLHRVRSYREILREQFQKHQHLLTAPIILVILALPRLIITFISKCMKSTDDAWLFLIGYFVSLIPPILTFVVFILPSKFYKTEFRKSVQSIRTTIQRRLTRNS